MSPADSTSNRGVPSTRRARAVALGRFRRGAAALRAENHQLRAEASELRTALRGRDGGVASPHDFGRLAEIALPISSRAPGAARQVIAHCLARLVAPRTLGDAQLLVSELVTNSLRHGELDERDAVLVRVYLAAEALRVEVENPGTAGVVGLGGPDLEAGRGFGLQLLGGIATRWGVSREQSTTVWFDMARA